MEIGRELLERLSGEVFHETADLDGDLGPTLDAFLDTLDPTERRALRDELVSLAGAGEEERRERLDEIGFAWEFDDGAGFLSTLAQVLDDE
ncbi:hypothetical protein [Antarcticirhabdus aurantiaca]|uniref:Uncharacterized protein n=1 Tax=Antarcticirhabdus aurantiaca TaxID=2606717 RepID=A0ACD4NS41_9HYPH|nr:hypothetical protein [Antarcticirhabdus aurantiaca]WAJ29450.1 hypothetical protein OXU80_04215 [Jeongeuplla avenae]